MMKRKLLAVVLPLVGCATVVGSGFAAWYFGDSVSGGDDAKFGATVNITEEVASTDTTLNGSSNSEAMPKHLILDQGPAKANGDANDIATQGIAFASSPKNVIEPAETVNDFVFTVNYNGAGKSLADLHTDGNYRVRVEVKIDLTALEGYVDLVTGAHVVMDETASDTIDGSNINFEGKDNIYTATYFAPTADASTTANWTFTLGLSTVNYENELLKYAVGKKPTTSEAYGDMTSAIGSNAQINILATAYLEIDTTAGA